MEKMKRIGAIIGVIILVGLYIITLVSAFITSPATEGLFMASIFSTVAIPVLLYAYRLVYRLLKKRGEEIKKETEHTDHKNASTRREDKE